MSKPNKPRDIGDNPTGRLLNADRDSLPALPLPAIRAARLHMPPMGQISPYECSLDGVSALAISSPKSKTEEDKIVRQFLSGLRKLLTSQNNWTFLQPLELSLENCARCQTCSEACPVFLGSGRQEIYRPIYRSEVLRSIKRRYLDFGGKARAILTGDDIKLSWTAIVRLAELAYRCTLCRRCAQVCPMGLDNGLIARELRKLFSQELGWAPAELHSLGTVRQLEVGSSTNMNPKAFKDALAFMEEEIEEKIGRVIKIPVDQEGADILLMQNAGDFMSWPENSEALAVIFDSAGLSWTMSSELVGYDAVNYGAWYDDVQLARLTMKHAQVARDLKVKRIVVGECGHAQKVMMVLADRILSSELNIPRESCFPLLEHIVSSGRLTLDPAKNNFPITLHDPCNIVRLAGIVEPQRRILRRLCPQFREMVPHGVNNYCCGGGSGFAIIKSATLSEWRLNVAGRMKIKQIMETFGPVMTQRVKKYVCAPCSNCKGQIKGLLSYHNLEQTNNIYCSGLAELIANAMVETKIPWLSGI